MSLTLALNNALAGLNVNQQSLAVLSQNIANANTAGYSRQILNQQAIYLDGQGAGVSIGDITRKVDQYLQRSVQLQSSTVGQTSVINEYNERIQLLMGNPGSQNSIDSYIGGFFNALHSLAQTPDDTTLQRLAINSGITLAGQVQHLASELRNLQYQADQDIRNAVNAVNNALRNLAQTNEAISKNTLLGKSTADLQDQRDRLLQEIGQYLDVQTLVRSNGTINLSTAGGLPLLDENLYELSYNGVAMPAAFSDGTILAPIEIYRLDSSGNRSGLPTELVSSGTSSQVVSLLTAGKIDGLLDIRDTEIPNLMGQLDSLVAALRDQVNRIHNEGTGFPGANSLTGERAVGASDYSEWAGSVRIAVLDQKGLPVPSPYPGESGVPPLTLDLATMTSSFGEGKPTTQSIIDAINRYYGVPQNKAQVGNLNNIQLISDSAAIPGSANAFSFDFNLTNMAADGSKFFVTGLQVKTNTGADITSLSSGIPTVALAAGNTYITAANSPVVTINTAGIHGLSEGQTVYLSDPGMIDGIPGSHISGYFTISNVTATSFQITAKSPALTGMSTGVAGQTATPPYGEVAPGETLRTKGNGIITADLTAAPSAAYYDITATVSVQDGDGVVSTAQVTYRIINQQGNLLNYPYAAINVNGNGSLVQPTSLTPIAQAMLVDANGNELSKVGGKYTDIEKGYLVIKTTNGTNVISIDSLDSKELGKPNNIPAQAGTNSGFSAYFGLNNFFKSNQLTATGDTVANSALNLQIQQRLVNNPGLIALGALTRTPASSNPNDPPRYTYERTTGDGSIMQRLASLGATSLDFAAVGGLGKTTQTLTGYAGAIIGVAATNAANAKTSQTNAQMLMDGYVQRSSSISGVNLDTELANTVIYQNAYAASARIITVANTLFDTLLQSV